MTQSTLLNGIALILLLGVGTLHAVPLDVVTNRPTPQVEAADTNTAETPNTGEVNQNAAVENRTEFEVAASEQKPQTLSVVCCICTININLTSVFTSIQSIFRRIQPTRMPMALPHCTPAS